MNKLIKSLIPLFIIISQVFAIAGFGAQLGQSMFSVEESSPTLSVPGVTLKNGAYDNAYSVGGYFYIDAIPVVDLEVDFNIQGNKYDINFENALGVKMAPLNFAWGSTDVYFTVRKKIIGIGIPFLAKAKLFAGGGYNTHMSTPLANETMLTNLCGDPGIANCDVTSLDKTLEEYMTDKDNYITSSGFHLQGGLQFKILMIDSFLFYRQVIADDVIPDAKGFGSLNLRLGMGL